MSEKCPHHVRRNHACPICARISQSLTSELGAPTGYVSVKERLPEFGQKVIARYEGVYEDRLVTFWKDYDLHPHFGLPNEPDGKGSQPATHWAPLLT